jgi:hypothetical protein
MLPNASLRAAFFSALICLHAVQSLLRSPVPLLGPRERGDCL